MGTAVSGAPEPELDADTKRLEPLLEQAYAARDAQEINRLETWLRLAACSRTGSPSPSTACWPEWHTSLTWSRPRR
jgi:hypothetical protein